MSGAFIEKLGAILIGPGTDPDSPHPDLRTASVLVPLMESRGTISFVFSTRTDSVPHHKGQICFPGGSRESGDELLLDTALREAEEEMGIRRDDVRILGRMEPVPTMTMFFITPYVCSIPPRYRFTPDPFEVEEIFTAPLEEFLDFGRYRTTETVFKGRSYPVYFIDYGEKTIWGATAKIVRKLAELVRESGLDSYL